MPHGLKSTRISIDLDNLITKSSIPDYNDYLEMALEDAYEEMEERILLKFMENAAKYGQDAHRLFNDLSIERFGDGFSISIDNEYAMYVEYGTGVVGQSSQHPKASEIGWVYDSKFHGHSGWWYPSREDDPNPYKWVDPQGVLRAWTRGQPSSPMMYDTWRWARQAFHPIFSKHLSSATKIYESEMNK